MDTFVGICIVVIFLLCFALWESRHEHKRELEGKDDYLRDCYKMWNRSRAELEARHKMDIDRLTQGTEGKKVPTDLARCPHCSSENVAVCFETGNAVCTGCGWMLPITEWPRVVLTGNLVNVKIDHEKIGELMKEAT